LKEINMENIHELSSPIDLRKNIEQALDPENYWEAGQRRIRCTPVFGCYRTPAYWVIVLDGSPPKGSLIVQTGWDSSRVKPDKYCVNAIFISSQGDPKKLRNKKHAMAVTVLLLKLNEQLGSPDYPVMDGPCAFDLTPQGLKAISPKTN
jgi:hypothetical protein